MPPFFRRIEGRYGRIEIPFLGVRIGETASWSCTRRAEAGEEAEFYNFHAVMKWAQDALFVDDDYRDKVRVIVRVGRDGADHWVKPIEGPGQRTVLTGGSLIMDRVILVKEA